MENKRVIIIHGWDGSPKREWFPWIKKELESRGFEVIVPDMPNTEEPKIKEWVNHISDLVKEPDKNTYFVGHSIGCQAILRYLESLDNKKVGGVILVAPWFTLSELETEEEKEVAEPWIETPVDFDKVKKTTDKFTVIFSDNDPYVPLKENKEVFEEKLNPKIIIEHDKGHFNEEYNISEIPVLLEELTGFIE